MSHLQFLVVEDQSIIRQFMAKELAPYGRVFEAEDENKAKTILGNIQLDLAFIDLNLTDSDKYEGFDLIQSCSEKGIPSVVLTGNEDQGIINEAFKRGAQQYFTKGSLVENDGFDHSILSFIKNLKNDNLDKFFENEFITRNEGLQSKIRFLREQVLNYDQKVMITGPSGVGKTKIAEYIHELTQPNKPLVSKNLTEISENLFEAELFGYKKGAFTGATQDKTGLLELANGGTLFLDEIGALPLNLQQKLLKVIEEGKFTPLGTNEVRTSKFRLITATCEDLGEKINNGDFRIDFYFRIKGVEVEIPALKERREDILPLIKHFISLSDKKIALAPEAQALLKAYDWHGNVRELRSLIQQFMSYTRGFIQETDLPEYIQNNTNPLDKKKLESNGSLFNPKMQAFVEEHGLPALVKEIEKEALAWSKERHGEKINALARHLQVSKSVFYRINEELNNG